MASWPRGRRARLAAWTAVGLALVLLAGLLPPVQAGVKSAAVLAEAFEVGVPRPLAADVERRTVRLAGVDGHLYRPDRRAPAVLFVPGATPAGLDDQRTRQFAEALAAAGRLVFVPDLELYEQRLAEGDLDRLARAGRTLPRRPEARGDDLALFGVSFGGSLALLAAADPRLRDRVAHVAVMGAYVDLVGVIEAATTGETIVGGQRFAWDDPHPDAHQVVREQALELVPEAQRAALAEALAAAGADDPAGADEPAGADDPDRLPREAAAVHALIANDDPERSRALVAELPREARALVERFSPRRVLDDIAAPITALHDRADPAVPFAELRRLERAERDVTTLAVELFDHVDPDVDARLDLGAVGDGWRTWRFGWRLLRAQETSLGALPPAQPGSGADSSSSMPRVSGRNQYSAARATTGRHRTRPATVNVPDASASPPKPTSPLTEPNTPAATSHPAAVARTDVGNTSTSSAPPEGV